MPASVPIAGLFRDARGIGPARRPTTTTITTTATATDKQQSGHPTTRTEPRHSHATMAAVLSATAVAAALPETPTALLAHGSRVYVGTAQGSLRVYVLDEDEENDGSDDGNRDCGVRGPRLQLAAERHALTPRARPIDALALAKEVDCLAILSDAGVSLCALTDLAVVPPSPLPQTRGALALAVDTSVQAHRRPSSSHPRAHAAWRVGDDSARLARAPRSPAPAVAGLRGMETLAAEKEAERKFLRARLRDADARRLSVPDASSADDAHDRDAQAAEMTLVTTLVVGVRRKLIFFRWVDGQFWDTREVPLPHSPRSIVLPTPTTLAAAYSLTEYTVLEVPLASESSTAQHHAAQDRLFSDPFALPLSSSAGPLVDSSPWPAPRDVSLPPPAEAVPTAPPDGYAGFGAALGQLLRAGTKQPDPRLVVLGDDSLLLCRRETGTFQSVPPPGYPAADTKPVREDITWPVTPETVVSLKPYILTLLPPHGHEPAVSSRVPRWGGGTGGAVHATHPAGVQLASATTGAVVQELAISIGHQDAGTTTLLPIAAVSMGASKGHVYVAAVPSDSSAAERVGATIFRLDLASWADQADALVRSGEYTEALALLDSLDPVRLPDRDERRRLVRTFRAVTLFLAQQYDEALSDFLALDTNPALVLALYPPSIAGDLALPPTEWLEAFGAPSTPAKYLARQPLPSHEANVDPSSPVSPASVSVVSVHPTPTRSMSHRISHRLSQADSTSVASLGSASGAMGTSPAQEPPEENADRARARAASASRRAARQLDALQKDKRRSLDALGKFLADRRRIYQSLLEMHPESHVAQTKSQQHADARMLRAIPSVPLPDLPLEQLADVARVVDTALLKTFLETKPGLVGSLCRLENWCEVDEVEQLLSSAGKYPELIALYGGKNMHAKALQLLRHFGEEVHVHDEEDMEERLGPTIRYLQNLDPKHLPVILDAAHWVLREDPRMGLEIFTADTGRVGSFRRASVAADLEQFDQALAIQYLETILDGGEQDTALHEKLIFLSLARAGELKVGSKERSEVLGKLLLFLERSQHYNASRVLARLPLAAAHDAGMVEIRAALLGRMGHHAAALHLYVDILHDVSQAERYCERVFSLPGLRTQAQQDVFLTLVQTLLPPPVTTSFLSSNPVLMEEGSSSQSQSQSQSAGGPKRRGLIRSPPPSRPTSPRLRSPPHTRQNSVSSSFELHPSAAAPPTEERVQTALGVLARHGKAIDMARALPLVPPFVPVCAVRGYVTSSLRRAASAQASARLLCSTADARRTQLDHALFALRDRHVVVTDATRCARCSRRLGTASGLAIDPTSGLVSHYFCRSTSLSSSTDPDGPAGATATTTATPTATATVTPTTTAAAVAAPVFSKTERQQQHLHDLYL